MSPEHRTTLHVLAFLFFRMGRMESAGRIYAALAAIPPDAEAHQPDWRTRAGLAAVAIEQEDGETALLHIRAAIDAASFQPEMPERTVLNHMHAKSLWLCGKKEEARAVANILVQPDAEKAAS